MAAPGAPHRWSRWLMRLLLVLSAWPASTTLADGQADYFVHHLPGAPESPLVKMHAGHIEVTPEHNGNLFFWHFQNHHVAQKQRTVIWLNGGPGCSSEDGALMEIGPYRLANDRTLVLNNGSWNEFANLLFVDNPVGTGFSFVDTNSYVRELDEMAAQFVAFMEKWYALFPEYEHDDLYLAGESYAGQHIPYIAQKVLERNRKPETQHRWNLAGILIGNGWISPADQYDAYLKFAYERNLLDRTSEASDQLQQLWRVCRTRIAGGDFHVDLQECEAVLQEFLKLTRKPGAGGGGAGGAPGSSDTCINMYDVRLTDSYPSCGMNWPPDLRYVTPYLRRPDVTEALHIRPAAKAWSECNGAVGSAFRARNSRPSVEILPSVLAEVPVLLFSGAEDLICNHVGTEQLIANLAWGGGKGFELAPGNLAPRRDWTVEGEPAGFWQEARNLTYVLFYNSSHMVPFDYPRRSRDMLDRFMGVDISSIGGVPTDSRLDGEKAGPSTSVGSDQTEIEEAAEEQRKLEEAKRTAYFKSGEVVLVIVAIAAAGWGYFVCRARRRREVQGYRGLSTGPAPDDVSRRRFGSRGRDLEAADFDEGELDDLRVRAPVEDGVGGGVDARYSAGGDTEDEEEEGELSGKATAAAATAADEKKKGQRRNGDSAESRPLTL